MPSNRSMSPPKRRTHRSASSSSLIAPYHNTTSHVRRLSRVPSTDITPSSSTSYLPRLASNHHFPMTPDCEPDADSFSTSINQQLLQQQQQQQQQLQNEQPLRAPSLSDHPISIPRLGAAVDTLIRVPAKGKPPRPYDPIALFILFTMFLVLFLLLLIVLRSIFPSTKQVSQQQNLKHIQNNINRINQNLIPLQFWPSSDSYNRVKNEPVPSPYLSNVSISRIWESRFLSNRKVKHLPLRLSIVAACKDRTGFLQTSLPSWLKLLTSSRDEIILVDWATSTPDFVPISEVVRSTPDSRVSVVTLSGSQPWVLSRAYNLAFSLARGEWILKFDCDTYVNNNDFLSLHPLPLQNEKKFYRFDWINARNRNEEHLNGIFLARTEHIRNINGYDERITTYGWEDSDLYARLQISSDNNNNYENESVVENDISKPGLKAIPFEKHSLKHILHDDNLRGKSQHLSMGPILETQVNSQASEGLPSWSIVGEHEKTSFQLNIVSRDARFLTATVVHSPSALMELISSTRRDVIVAEAVNRVLHDGYGVPWGSLSELDQSKEHIVRVLAAGGRRRISDSVIFSVLEGSTADKMLGLASALMFASAHRRPLFLTWGNACFSSSAATYDNENGKDITISCKVSDFFDIDTNISTSNNYNHNYDSNINNNIIDSTNETNDSNNDSDIYNNNTNINNIILNESKQQPQQPLMHTSRMTSATAVAQSSRPVFYLTRWKCRVSLSECASTDPAFNTMEEFSSTDLLSSSTTSITDENTNNNNLNNNQLDPSLSAASHNKVPTSERAKYLEEIVTGKVEHKKRHVVLKLHSHLPFHGIEQVQYYLSSLKPSSSVSKYIQLLTHDDPTSLSDHIGLYIGSSVTLKSIDSLIHRVRSLSNSNNNINNEKLYFVTGPNIETVQYARNLLKMSSVIKDGLQSASQYFQQNYLQHHQTDEKFNTIRQIAELYVLAKCKEVVNDGRPSQSVLSVIKAFKLLKQ